MGSGEFPLALAGVPLYLRRKGKRSVRVFPGKARKVRRRMTLNLRENPLITLSFR